MDYRAIGTAASTIEQWARLILLPIGGIWVLINYDNNRKAKAAEVLLALEVQYRDGVVATLLNLESNEGYTKYAGALRKVCQSPSCVGRANASAYLDGGERKALEEIERAMRHLLVARSLAKLGINRDAPDSVYGYYATLVSGENERRPELAPYVRMWWPQVASWGEQLRRNRVQRVQHWPREMWGKLVDWFQSSKNVAH